MVRCVPKHRPKVPQREMRVVQPKHVQQKGSLERVLSNITSQPNALQHNAIEVTTNNGIRVRKRGREIAKALDVRVSPLSQLTNVYKRSEYLSKLNSLVHPTDKQKSTSRALLPVPRVIVGTFLEVQRFYD